MAYLKLNCDEEHIVLKDNDFKRDSLFNFQNNKYVNSIFINEIKSTEFSSLSQSKNIEIKDGEIKIKDIAEEGIYISSVICTDEKFGLGLNNFFLMIDEEKEPGTSIEYFIVFNDDRTFPLKANGDMPLKIDGIKPINFKIRARLLSNVFDTPKIKSLAVCYYDKMVENQLGLINPNLRPNDIKEEEKVFLEFESLADLE